jgi:hypothetical protein
MGVYPRARKRQKVKTYFLCGKAAFCYAKPAFGCLAAFALVPVYLGFQTVQNQHKTHHPFVRFRCFPQKRASFACPFLLTEPAKSRFLLFAVF